MKSYTLKLRQRIETVGSHLCVGLDPRAEHCDGALKDFLLQVLEETAPYAAAYKPNLAYYEAFGSKGLILLEEILATIPKEIPVILDAKRSDIGETQEHYAQALFDVWKGDAVTLNPLMGFDSIVPFLAYPGRAAYLLGVTSNPGAADFLLKPIEGRYLFEHLSDWQERASDLPGELGMVTGLTHLSPDIQSKLPDWPLLAPGLGAQGGSPEVLCDPNRHAPNLINVSRGILYRDLEQSFADKARTWRDRIEQALSLRE